MYRVKAGGCGIQLHSFIRGYQLSHRHLLKRLFFLPIELSCHLCQNECTVNVKVYFWTYNLFLVDQYVDTYASSMFY